ncbi:MAG TPA: hypothetical protein PLA83_07020 [Deltaproteobacteria bacterium]|jgi:hypothetical protein|nr:hypothetical protein [Deltaproteobacteria bacterium]HQI00747.1 hypothetical protein [Deltaproteobacteria bacterium]HQJ08726.1 hypothetical protein [Deltaproteobacteria bacterium]
MIYYNLMETLRKNEYFLTRDLVREIRESPETSHYRAVEEDKLYNWVHQVIYHTYKRHSAWLGNDTSKNTIFAYYSELGKQRRREGLPLQDIVQSLFLIKKRIYQCITERMALETDYTAKETTELFVNLDLFYDRVAQAIIAGYQKETGSLACA